MSSADTKKLLDRSFDKQNSKNVSNEQHNRAFYSARTISQQTEPSFKHLELETAENQERLSALALSPHTSTIHPDVETYKEHYIPPLEKYPSIRKSKLKTERQLGGIELMYFESSSRGADTICLMTKVEAVYPITEVAARQAMNKIMLRHPLLRMTFSSDISSDNNNKSTLSFVHNDSIEGDFLVSPRRDWLQYLLEEVEKPFDNEFKPLWRCRLLNSSKIERGSPCSCKTSQRSSKCENKTNPTEAEDDVKFEYQATFLFIMHHSVMDGGYSLWMFQEFINFLDAYVTNKNIGSVRELPLLPPVEKCLAFQNQNIPETWPLWTDCYLQFAPESYENKRIINDYNARFRDEIAILSHNKPSNSFHVFKLCRADTKAFVNACKRNGSTPNGAFLAASLLAMIDLIYPCGHTDTQLEIPFELMMDLRRHCQFGHGDESMPHYPGVASIYIPLIAHIQIPDKTTSVETFWKMSASFTNSVQRDISSPDTFDWIKRLADSYVKGVNDTPEASKSNFVLCVSNMGKLDGVLHNEISERIRLADLHGTSSVLIEDMPIFFVTTFALNGHCYGNVSFCRGYTSTQTASKFMGYLQKYLINYSKL